MNGRCQHATDGCACLDRQAGVSYGRSPWTKPTNTSTTISTSASTTRRPWRSFRTQKDEYFREGGGSPIPPADRDTFAGLAYYPVDPTLAFDDLTLGPYTGTEPVQFEIPTSDGRLRPAERAGIFAFAVQEVACRLTAYRFASGGSRSLACDPWEKG